MALRLRRGTDAERLLITPLEGELIYATDTKLLWVGDGTTAGGILATSAGGGSYTLQGLTDTQVNTKSDGQVLTWSSGDNAWIPTTVSGVGLTSLNELTDVNSPTPSNGQVLQFDGVALTWNNVTLTLDALADVSTQAGVANGDFLIYDGFNFTPKTLNEILGSFPYTSLNVNINGNLDGDLKGSVFAEDSTVMVDAQNSVLSNGQISIVNDVISTAFSDNITMDVEILNAARLHGVDGTLAEIPAVSIEGLRGTPEAPASVQVGDYIGQLTFTAYDGVGSFPKAIITAQIDNVTGTNALPGKILIGPHDYDGNYGAIAVSIDSRGTLEAPTMKVTPYADATARDAAIPSPEAGMIVYITSTNKHQGYNGTTWNDFY